MYFSIIALLDETTSFFLLLLFGEDIWTIYTVTKVHNFQIKF